MTEKASEIISRVDLDGRGGGEPLAQRLAREVGRLIREGRLRPGQKLPPTVQLAEMLGVSRQVAQDGLALLAQRNLLRRKPGLGTMVLEPRETPTIGLLAFVGGGPSLTADVGWAIANDFIHLMDGRGWEHCEYVTSRQSHPPAMPPRLTDDLLERRLDALVYGTIYESFIEENVPSSEVPALYINPEQTRALDSIDRAVDWLGRQECRNVGALFEVVPQVDEIAAHYVRRCRRRGMKVPSRWVQKGCGSSISVGRAKFHELYAGGEAPDGLLIMDDMIAYGLIEEAREEEYYLDHSRIVVMVNKGSNLFIPPACPRIEIDWRVVIERELERWLDDSGGRRPTSEREGSIYRFLPHAGGREEFAAAHDSVASAEA
jgi:hypothetical protein